MKEIILLVQVETSIYFPLWNQSMLCHKQALCLLAFNPFNISTQSGADHAESGVARAPSGACKQIYLNLQFTILRSQEVSGNFILKCDLFWDVLAYTFCMNLKKITII